jgi:hypothetical protein
MMMIIRQARELYADTPMGIYIYIYIYICIEIEREREREIPCNTYSVFPTAIFYFMYWQFAKLVTNGKKKELFDAKALLNRQYIK